MKNTKTNLGEKVFSILFALFLAAVFWLSKGTLLSYVDAYRAGTGFEALTTTFDTTLNADFPKKSFFIDLNGLGHRLLAQRSMNDVVKLKDGSQSVVMDMRSEELILHDAEALTRFSQWVTQEKDADFLYVQVPLKNAYCPNSANTLPAGLSDHSDEIADVFLARLEENEVPYLDLRECIRQDGIDILSLYLRTEHHWSAYGAFYAYEKICDYLERAYGEDIDPEVLDLDNWQQDILKRSSLGYYAQRTGFLFGGFDDFPLIYPKFPTESTCDIPHKDVHREGSFYDAIFDQDFPALPWRDRTMYPVYIGGDFPLVIHENKLAKNPETVMIFIDSYGTMVESFLTAAYQHVIAVDQRWVLRYGWSEVQSDYVERYEPDVVIVQYNPNQIGLENCEQFWFFQDAKTA